MLQRILYLMYKEFLAVWRDKKSRTVLVIPPIVQLFIFAFAATLDVQNVTIGILNRDRGEKGFELVQRFRGSPTFKNLIYLDSIADVKPFIDNQRGFVVLSIDEQFSRNLDAKKPAKVQLILDGRKSNAAQIVAGYATTIFDQFNRDYFGRAQMETSNSQVITINWFNPNLIYYWFNVPNLSGVITMFVGLIVTALSVAREKELGTFEQLLVSPMQPVEIMIGKTVPAILIGMIEGSIIIFAGILFFQIPFTGHLLYLYFNMFFFVTAIVGIGLFVSALCNTQQQAILGTYMFTSPAILLSGFATPIENMPSWLQAFTYLNPLRYYLIVAKGVFLKAMPFSTVFHNTWPVILIAAANLTFATLFFRRKVF